MFNSQSRNVALENFEIIMTNQTRKSMGHVEVPDIAVDEATDPQIQGTNQSESQTPRPTQISQETSPSLPDITVQEIRDLLSASPTPDRRNQNHVFEKIYGPFHEFIQRNDLSYYHVAILKPTRNILYHTERLENLDENVLRLALIYCSDRNFTIADARRFILNLAKYELYTNLTDPDWTQDPTRLLDTEPPLWERMRFPNEVEDHPYVWELANLSTDFNAQTILHFYPLYRKYLFYLRGVCACYDQPVPNSFDHHFISTFLVTASIRATFSFMLLPDDLFLEQSEAEVPEA
jgi:hypothetical protein